VLLQLEACGLLLAPGDERRSGLDFLVIDVEDVARRCFGLVIA
jgi:hypothetical protein